MYDCMKKDKYCKQCVFGAYHYLRGINVNKKNALHNALNKYFTLMWLDNECNEIYELKYVLNPREEYIEKALEKIDV
jgi:hypothetical protein